MPRSQATVVAGGEEHVFEVELADTDATRSRGLMFRREMAEDAGMLFDFETERLVTMWMRNTYIPLDMVFIRADGTVARIARDTEPFSEETISSGEPVLAVLEVNAGTAERIGLAAGDAVRHPIFER